VTRGALISMKYVDILIVNPKPIIFAPATRWGVPENMKLKSGNRGGGLIEGPFIINPVSTLSITQSELSPSPRDELSDMQVLLTCIGQPRHPLVIRFCFIQAVHKKRTDPKTFKNLNLEFKNAFVNQSKTFWTVETVTAEPSLWLSNSGMLRHSESVQL